MKEYKKVVSAIQNEELISYLEGKGAYKIDLHHWVGAKIPTDITRVLSEGIYIAFRKEPKLDVKKRFEEALISMMDKELFDLYLVTKYTYVQILNEIKYQDSPFSIDWDNILPKLRFSLIRNEDKLRSYFEWEGEGEENGVWEEISRINRMCFEKCKISFF
ncbi:NAD+ glycohydrolase toxin immunity protein [Ancylomarina subtilis]|uniref:NAD+ glycohydrolase toxin immunity protein n=1 Tax=Ancylomarina subtilis TaxID=1639035 RepID=A0A4Q7VK88_9BACT|nr:NAD glycohydrolase toxin immunity factor [Ancylomarina subtilis]RZT96589.1 NAD+ glycohydrolase toxin immunity protein [Ancylomarina subtilis]